MDTDNGKIGFSVELENANLKRQIKDTQREFARLGEGVTKESNLIDASLAKIKNTVAGIAAAYSFKELARKVATVRGEFQQLEVAFKTMLGSKEKADTLMAQMVTTAATTPFDLQSVAGGAKQLLAYGIAAENVNKTLIRLGDIAAGLSIPLNDLVWLYGTTKSQGRLYAQDLNQFTGRGIPMIAELAKQFGVAESKVKELVSEGKVGFPEVEKAIENLTNKGGKFGGLMDAQSKTINGQISNIEDSISSMFNDIGKSNEGLINSVLGGVSSLVENYERVGRVLMGVAATYGTYKAAVMANIAIQNVMAKQAASIEAARLESLSKVMDNVKKAESATATSAETTAIEANTIAKNANKSAIDADVAAMQKELATRAQLAVANYKDAVANYNNATSKAAAAALEVDAANDKVQAMQDAYDAAVKSNSSEAIATAELNLNTASQEANAAARNLNTARKDVATAASTRAAAATASETAAQKLNTFQTKVDTVNKTANTAATGLWTAVTKSATRAMRALYATMAANPLMVVALAVGGIVTALSAMKTEEERLKAAEEDYQKKLSETISLEDERKSKMEELANVASDESLATDTRREALDKLGREYPNIFEKYDTEYEKLKNIKRIKLEIAEFEAGRSMSNPENQLKTLNDKIKSLEDKKATEQWVDANASGTKMKKIGGLSQKETDELKIAYQERAKLQKSINMNNVLTYWDNIRNKGVSDKFLRDQLKSRESLLATMKMRGSKYGKLNPDGVSYSEDELKHTINKINDEINRRGAKRQSSEDWQKTALGAYEKALKAYNDFKDSKDNNLTQEEYETKFKELKSAMESAKKAYTDTGGKVKSASDTDKEQKEAERMVELQKRLNYELEDLNQKNEEESLRFMEEGTQKRLKQIDLDYSARKKEIAKQEADWKAENKKAGLGSELTDVQKSALTVASEQNEQSRQKSKAAVFQDEVKSMREYLKEYGSLMQKREAIDQEYEELKRKAQTEGERKTLDKQKQKELGNSDVTAMLKRVDWATAFSDLGIAFKGQLQPIFDELNRFVKTDGFRGQNASDQKAIIDAIERMRPIVGESAKWEDLASSMGAYQKSLNELQAATEREAKIKADIALYEKQKKAVKGNPLLETSIDATIEYLKGQLDEAGESVVNATEKVNSSGVQVSATSKAVIQPVSEVTTWLQNSGIPQLGELSSAFDRLKGGIAGLKALGEAGKAAKDMKDAGQDIADAGEKSAEAIELIGPEIAETLGKGGLIAQIVSAILTILDVLKDGIGPLIASIIDSVLGAIDGIIENILTLDFLKQIIGSLVKGIGNILKHVAEGIVRLGSFGMADINWTGSNAKEVQRTIDRLTQRNESLQTSIEDLTDEIKASKGAKSVDAYHTAYKNQKEQNQNYLDIAKAQASYHNHHNSWNKYWDGFTEEQMAWIKANVNADFNGDIFSLSPEEMKKLRANVEIWEQIQNTGKGGYGERLTDKLDEYIDQAGKLEDLTNQLYEGLTGISFDGMYDSFVNKLMDMKYSAQDAAKDMSEMFMKAMLSNQIGELYSERLKEWWERFGKSMKDGSLSEEERNSLAGEYQGIVNEAVKLRDELASATGYDQDAYSQEGSKKGFATASQDSVDELSGRMTAIAMDASLMKDDVSAIKAQNAAMTENLSEIRGLSMIAVERLEDIEKNTHELYQINDRLGKIEKNTRNI